MNKYPSHIKKGQRWLYKDEFGNSALLEAVEDNRLPNDFTTCKVVQNFPGFQWGKNGPEVWPFNLYYLDRWTYLEGQDTP